MERLPVPGEDDGAWGEILNGFLRVIHNEDGGLKSSALPATTAGQKGVIRLGGDLGGTADKPTVPALADMALDSEVVHNSGDETIKGVKTFKLAPGVPDGSFPQSKINNLASDLAAKYEKPSGGIPESDMSQNVQDSLDQIGNATSVQGVGITDTTPSGGQALVYSNSTGEWGPGTPSSSDGNEYIEGNGISKVTVGQNAPSSPQAGDLWIDTS